MKKIDKKRLLFYVEYTALFAVFMFAILYFYRSQGKAIVHNSNDGFKQNYRALLYISNYYKTILNNIFVTHTFVIPQWDFAIGEGADIIETFHYYGLGDPINLLSVFFNESNLYIFHDLSIFLRMYLSGIVFSCLCFYKKYNKNIIILTGSILYAYCSYTFRVMTNYIYFINPVLYFPLVILGVEKIFDENKGRLLTIAVALSAITSIYFFYMIVIGTVLYVAIRILVMKDSIKNKLLFLLKIFIYSLFGVLISAVMFMPAAYSMLGNARTSSGVDVATFYGVDWYIALFRDLIFNGYRGGYYGGYTVLGLFAIITIIKNRKNKQLSWLLLVAFIILAFPIFGSIFNAGTYITERYEFIVGLLVVYCIVASYDNFSKLSKDIYIYLILLVIYLVVGFVNDPDEKMSYMVHFALGIGTLVSFRILKKDKYKEIIFLLVVLATLSFNIAYKYLPNYWNHAGINGMDINNLINIHNEEPSIFDKIDDDSFYRYSGNSLPDNVSVNGDKSSTGYYWSVSNNNVADFRTAFGFHDIANFYYSNYDGDYVLNTLAGVKYYFVKDGEIIPYGYTLYKEYENYDLYINENALPIMYGYDCAISNEEFNNASIEDRQELLTKYVVTDEESDGNKLTEEAIDISCDISSTEGMIFDIHNINVLESGAQINANFSSEVSGEYYFVIEGLYPEYESYIDVTCGDVSANVLSKNKNSHAYGGRHTFEINLGYHDGFSDSVTLTFSSECTYTYDKISVYCLPVQNLTQNLNELNCIDINDLTIVDNVVSANIYSNENKYLCIAIPNYDGWKAYLDGQEIELNKYNIMYMGFPISAGSHSVELVYETPLLKTGAIISGLSLIGFIIFEVIISKHNKKDVI